MFNSARCLLRSIPESLAKGEGRESRLKREHKQPGEQSIIPFSAPFLDRTVFARSHFLPAQIGALSLSLSLSFWISPVELRASE